MAPPPCIVPSDYEPLFYAGRKVLLLTHTAACIVLLGSATHHVLHMRRFLKGQFERLQVEKTVARVMAVSYVVCFALGAILYPTFRYHVRALYLDRYYPWASNLFDIKENFASIALILAISVGLLSLRLDPEKEKYALRIYAFMSLIVAAVAWLNAISGFLIASYKAV